MIAFYEYVNKGDGTLYRDKLSILKTLLNATYEGLLIPKDNTPRNIPLLDIWHCEWVIRRSLPSITVRQNDVSKWIWQQMRQGLLDTLNSAKHYVK